MSAIGKVTVLLIALSWLVVVAFSQTPKSAIESIRSALQDRQFDRAMELSSVALRESPGNAQLWTLQGIALSGKGDNQKALAAFRQALKISPDYVAALQGAAQIEYQVSDPGAVRLLNHLLHLRPEETTAHAMLAVLMYRDGNCKLATMHFEKAAALLDSQLDALHAYATCLMKLRQFDAAAQVFQRAIALRPDDPKERHLLASIQLMSHKPEEAIETLQPLVEGRSPDAATLELAAAACEQAKDTPRAVNLLRQAILLEPRNVNLYLDFANIAFAHESFQVGIDIITDGLKLQPQAPALYMARGVLYVQLANYENAEADFQKAYELDPNESLSSAAQALAEVQANDLDHALSTVQAKLTRKPNDALLLYLQADILAQKGADPGTSDFDLAMRSAKRAVTLQPRLGSAHGVLAKLYMQAQQYQQAVAECGKALEIDPRDQTALYRLIQAQRKIGNKSEIPELLKRLALVREQETKEERERYRYKLVEGEDAPSRHSAQP